MDKSTNHLCKSNIQLPYDIRSLNVLRVFIAESLSILNISPSTIQSFVLASEEIFSYILFHHIAPKDDDLIIMKYRLLKDSLLEFELRFPPFFDH